MKYLKYILILVIFSLGIKSVCAFDNTLKVYDYALILSSKEEQKLKEEVEKYIKNNNIDMALITVKYFNQDTVENYLSEFYSKNEFGLGDNQSAIMIAVSLKDDVEDIKIKVFGEAASLYSDDEIKEMSKKVSEKDKYYDKLKEFIYYSNKYINSNANYSEDNIFKSIDLLLVAFISLLVSSIVTLFAFLRHKNNLKIDSNISYVTNLEITTKNDKFVTTNTKKKALTDKR